jgi:hypothetical protein
MEKIIFITFFSFHSVILSVEFFLFKKKFKQNIKNPKFMICYSLISSFLIFVSVAFLSLFFHYQLNLSFFKMFIFGAVSFFIFNTIALTLYLFYALFITNVT